MKTNQEMMVNIGNNHTIKIGHLTKMGRLSDVFAIGIVIEKIKDYHSYLLLNGLEEKMFGSLLLKLN